MELGSGYEDEAAATRSRRQNKLFYLGILLVAVAVVGVIVVIPVVLVTSNKNNDNSKSESVSNSATSDASTNTGETYELASSQSTSSIGAEDIDAKFLVNNNASSYNYSAPSDGELPIYAGNSTNGTEDKEDKTNVTSTNPTFAPTTGSISPAVTEATPAQPTGPIIAKLVDSFVVLETLPHDPDAFTQGLTFDPNDRSIVYESTGLYGQSSVRKVDIQTGQVLLQVATPAEIFGEGLAFYTTDEGLGRLIHITWKSQRGFIFDAATLQQLEEFQFSTALNEGWGVTYNPNTDQFIVTDGSNFLHFWDRRTLAEVNRVEVMMRTSDTSPPEGVFNLNEIEWDDATQTVLSNIWQDDTIVRINPTTGEVITAYDLSELYTDRLYSADVLNGIAISPDKELWITGKKWPLMYKIEFNE